jgi:hypothetical protein
MIRSLLRISALLVVSAAAAVSHAGAKMDTMDVGITLADHVFYGQVGRARSGPGNEYISCNVLYYTNGAPMVQCSAQDSNVQMPQSAMCVSTATAHADVLKTVTNYSFLVVNYDASGNCTSIQVQNSSQFPPMVP